MLSSTRLTEARVEFIIKIIMNILLRGKAWNLHTKTICRRISSQADMNYEACMRICATVYVRLNNYLWPRLLPSYWSKARSSANERKANLNVLEFLCEE